MNIAQLTKDELFDAAFAGRITREEYLAEMERRTAPSGGRGFAVKITQPGVRKDGTRTVGGSINFQGVRGAPVRFGLTMSSTAILDLMTPENLRSTLKTIRDGADRLRWSKDGQLGEGVPREKIEELCRVHGVS